MIKTAATVLLSSLLACTPLLASALATVADTVPLASAQRAECDTTTCTFSYTIPAGTNQVLMVLLYGGSNLSALSQNGTSFLGSVTQILRTVGTPTDAYQESGPYFAYLASPTSGTFSMTTTGSQYFIVFTVNGANTAAPFDLYGGAGTVNSLGKTMAKTLTTTVGNDLLVAFNVTGQTSDDWASDGAGETNIMHTQGFGTHGVAASYKAAASGAGSETMTINYTNNNFIDEAVIAIQSAAAVVSVKNAISFISFGF